MNMPTPKYCPATGNQPLTCTRKGFAASCAKFRAHAKRKWTGKSLLPRSIQSDYCLICQGDVPDNVTFIDVPLCDRPQGDMIDVQIVSPDRDKQTSTKENTMPASKTFKGICDSCGGEKTLAKHFGKLVCNSCLSFRIGANKHPYLVLAALKEFGNLPVIDGSLVPPGDKKSAETIDQVKEILKGQTNEDVIATATRRMQVLAKLEESFLQESKALSDAMAERAELKKEVAVLLEENDMLKNELRQAADDLRNNQPTSTHTTNHPIDSALLDIALGIMSGTITGLDADGLRRLRP